MIQEHSFAKGFEILWASLKVWGVGVRVYLLGRSIT